MSLREYQAGDEVEIGNVKGVFIRMKDKDTAVVYDKSIEKNLDVSIVGNPPVVKTEIEKKPDKVKQEEAVRFCKQCKQTKSVKEFDTFMNGTVRKTCRDCTESLKKEKEVDLKKLVPVATEEPVKQSKPVNPIKMEPSVVYRFEKTVSILGPTASITYIVDQVFNLQEIIKSNASDKEIIQALQNISNLAMMAIASYKED